MLRLPKSVVCLSPSTRPPRPPIACIATTQLRTKRTNKSLLWQTQGLTKGNKAPTQLLFNESLERLFSGEEILFNARKAVNIKLPGLIDEYLEVDAYIPRLKLPIEFQDPYHYTPAVYYANRSLTDIQKADAAKKKVLSERGEPLLQLPCWWNGTDESLAATIKAIRPDLLQHLSPSSPPVSDTKPDNFFLDHQVPGVGVPMRPVFFSNVLFSRGREWLICEKYDGVRCVWNPEEKALYSRLGNKLRFPDEFKAKMPNEFLDCEAWFGSGYFQEASKLRSVSTAEVDWNALRLIVFDIANPDSGGLPYVERYKKLFSLVDPEHPYLLVPGRVQLESEEQRHEFEQMIGKHGGEGVLLIERNSPYEAGNTGHVLKIKPAIDKEALVVSSDSKSLTVQLPDETVFRILTPGTMQQTPKVGDVITITYKRYVNGSTLPHQPEILRVRSDVTWDEVIATSNVQPGKRDFGRNFSGRWDINIEDLRGYFVKYAQKHNFDPLVPANWYKVRGVDILAEKGAINRLKAFNGSYIDAVVESFPDIGLDKSKFLHVPVNHWKDIKNVRKYFEEFAKEKGFDPLNPNNWYNITSGDIVVSKGHGLTHYHKRSHINALIAAFPEIGLDKAKFSTVPMHHWKDIKNVRKFFEEFAKEQGFDPLNANNWYTVTSSDFSASKGALSYHNYSHINALVAAFPEIGLDKSKFSVVPRSHWKEVTNVRMAFEEFAKEKNFDLLVPNNWYNINGSDFVASKGQAVIKHFNNSFVNALIAAFPEIQIDKAKFSIVPKHHWKDTKNVRKLFEEIAKEKGFDPLVPNNWYNVKSSDIAALKGAIAYYQHSHINALIAAFPEIGLDKSKFSAVPRSHWKDLKNIRKFFEDFAKDKGFDPFVADNWYSFKRSDIIASKGTGAIMYYDGYIDALVAAFPEIGLDKAKFYAYRNPRLKPA